MATSSEDKSKKQERGSRAFIDGHNLEHRAAELYRLIGYSVEERRGFDGREVDLFITQRLGDLQIHRAIECKLTVVTAEDLDIFLNKLKLVRREYPNALGGMVSLGQFTPSVASHAAREGITLTTFRDLEASLIDGHGYCLSLIQEIENNETYRLTHFIEPQMAIEKGTPKAAFEVVNSWLSDDGWNQLTILGDVGTGKSFLTRCLTHRLAQEYLADPVNAPLPVRIDLREADRHFSLEGLIMTHFANTNLRTTRFDVFQHFLSAGRSVLILDGFDEMAAKINPKITIKNFYELTRAVTGKAKVLITCRTHYFKSRDHEEEVLLGATSSGGTNEARELYWDIISRKGYNIAYVQPFSIREVEQFVRKSRGVQAEAALATIQQTYNLIELSQTPMLLEMIVRSINSLRSKEINAATLYGIYTDAWIHRERWRNLLDNKAKLDFLLALARVLWNEDLDVVHHSRLTRQVETHFASEIEHQDLAMAELDAEIRTATFLTRDSVGNYGFAHKSYLEYFVAKGVAQELTTESVEPSLRIRRLSPEVLSFLVLLVKDEKVEVVLEKIVSQPYQLDISENALILLYEIRRASSGPDEMIQMPEYVQMQSAKLQQVLLSRSILKSANFANASLNEAGFVSCDLSGSIFDGASLQNANLANSRAVAAKFCRASMERCDFQKSDLTSADLSESILRSAFFTGANLTGASFEKSDTLGTIFDAVDPLPVETTNVLTRSLDDETWNVIQHHALILSAKYRIDAGDLIALTVQSILQKRDDTSSAIKQWSEAGGIKELIAEIAHDERQRQHEKVRRGIARFRTDTDTDVDILELAEVEIVNTIGSADIENKVLANEVLAIMENELSETTYEMVVLRYRDGYTEQEIGKMLNVSAKSVSSQIHRALLLARNLLRHPPISALRS
jgi:DNA-directed RNA polymerase specialized sigma24 family protein